MNYNMNGWDKPISELHGMLKAVDKSIPRKIPQVLMIREGQVKKKKEGKNSKWEAMDWKGQGEESSPKPITQEEGKGC